MRFAQHEVPRQVRINLTTKAASIEHRPKRQLVLNDLMRIAISRIRLVALAYVPVNPLVPLHRVIAVSDIGAVVVVSLPATPRLGCG